MGFSFNLKAHSIKTIETPFTVSTNDTEQRSYTLEISYTVERYFYTTVMSNEVLLVISTALPMTLGILQKNYNTKCVLN